MLNSAPDLSASRWAPHPHNRASSPYISSQPTHTHNRTTTPPVVSTSPSRASRTPTATPLSRRSAPTPSEHRRQSLTLHNRLFQRLKWRASLLLTAHAFAQSPDTHGIGLTATEADTQFRIDFFEFYVLLERCLLHLLAAVGVRVSAGYDPNRTTANSSTANPQPSNGSGIIGDSKVGASAIATRGPAHAFHQNLLDALSSPHENPLYAILGTGRVREYIGLAKDLRNGWKESGSSSTATASASDSAGVDASHSHTHAHIHTVARDTLENGGVEAEAQRLRERLGRRYAEVLRELRLDEMLRVVLGAVEEARGVAGREVERFVALQKGARSVSVDMTDAAGVGMGMGIMDEQQQQQLAERPLESMGLGAGWEGDEMEFD